MSHTINFLNVNWLLDTPEHIDATFTELTLFIKLMIANLDGLCPIIFTQCRKNKSKGIGKIQCKIERLWSDFRCDLDSAVRYFAAEFVFYPVLTDEMRMVMEPKAELFSPQIYQELLKKYNMINPPKPEEKSFQDVCYYLEDRENDNSATFYITHYYESIVKSFKEKMLHVRGNNIRFTEHQAAFVTSTLTNVGNFCGLIGEHEQITKRKPSLIKIIEKIQKYCALGLEMIEHEMKEN